MVERHSAGSTCGPIEAGNNCGVIEMRSVTPQVRPAAPLKPQPGRVYRIQNRSHSAGSTCGPIEAAFATLLAWFAHRGVTPQVRPAAPLKLFLNWLGLTKTNVTPQVRPAAPLKLLYELVEVAAVT